jgi:hypothetical protein|tara:strand:+ start:122 stop:334 length:213 start_codon:yes stop_codon:yes gene_type:complete
MMKAPIAMFDIADGGFTFYNEEQWAVALAEWRTELRVEQGIDVDYFNEYDLVEMKFGDEVFIEEIPQNVF